MNKTAIITGIRGQDGSYLAKLLLDKGYRVIGTDRRRVDQNNWRLRYVGVGNELEIEYMDLLDDGNINRLLKKVQPDEFYNLAAQSFVGASFDQPLLTANVDAMGVLRILEAIRTFSPHTKFYQASTSEMFGKVQEIPQKESTPFYPRSPYGVSKLFGHWIVKNYRESFDMFATSGILFNHESPLRGLEFVTRKITHAVASIKLGKKDRLILGNMDAKRDWGFAKEYVEGMWRMLNHPEPDDFVLATNETHSVREFTEEAFRLAGFDIKWEGKEVNEKGIDSKSGKVLVEISKRFYRPAEVEMLIGDPQKAKDMLGWEPKIKYKDLVKIMYDSDLKLLSEKS